VWARGDGQYKEAKKEATNKIRNAKRKFEKKLARENLGNSRPFFAYVKGKTESRFNCRSLCERKDREPFQL
jgi:hypothetical protein